MRESSRIRVAARRAELGFSQPTLAIVGVAGGPVIAGIPEGAGVSGDGEPTPPSARDLFVLGVPFGTDIEPLDG